MFKNKVISDHILIYRPSETSFLSIIQRITGVLLFLVVFYFLFLFTLKEFSFFSFFHFSNILIYNFFFIFFIFIFNFHFLNGLRIHLNESFISSSQVISYSNLLKIQIKNSNLILNYSFFTSLLIYLIYLFNG